MGALDAEELLIEAKLLVASKGSGARLQMKLRRGVSTAYYALFHLLVGEASRGIARGMGPSVAALVARAFVHDEMKEACKPFAGGGLPPILTSAFPGIGVSGELRDVAQAFSDLQQARHEADYGTTRRWTTAEAVAEVARAESAFDQWKALKSSASPNDGQVKNAFLIWLVLGKTLRRR